MAHGAPLSALGPPDIVTFDDGDTEVQLVPLMGEWPIRPWNATLSGLARMVVDRVNIKPERIWVVCPSYGDVVSFCMLRKRVLEELELASVTAPSVRFVLVDDTGGDDEEIDELRPLRDVTVVTPPFNLGHQRALVYGLRTVAPEFQDSDIVVTMDADGEDRPEDLPRLLNRLLEVPVDRRAVAIAQRTERTESLKFKTLYLFFRLMFRTLTGMTVRSGNYAAYRGRLAKRMLQHPYFDLCYSSSLVSLDISTIPVPCPRGERYAGHSRMNFFRLFMHGLRMLMPFTDRIAVRALATFSAIFSIGVLTGLAVVGVRVFTHAAIPGWATATLICTVILSSLALGNFVVLFAVFSHSRGISLAGLEERRDHLARSSPATADR